MARSIVGFPIRLGVRGASIAVDGAMTVAGHALGLVGRLAEALTKDGGPDLDIDGREREPREERERVATEKAHPRPRARTRPARTPGPASVRPAEAARTEPEPEPAPAPIDPSPTHVSEEAVLVDEVAEIGAEDGAGAEVHVDEPWENYDVLGAGDVVDRITGASTAVLAAVGLYEQTHRRRKTVLEAVERELRRSQ